MRDVPFLAGQVGRSRQLQWISWCGADRFRRQFLERVMHRRCARRPFVTSFPGKGGTTECAEVTTLVLDESRNAQRH
jgi:hypothetical protein